jgi:hypothetical protein
MRPRSRIAFLDQSFRSWSLHLSFAFKPVRMSTVSLPFKISTTRISQFVKFVNSINRRTQAKIESRPKT